jgi:hypothetical protein
LKMVRTAGDDDACPIQRTFTSSAKIYVSMRLYFPSTIWGTWDVSAEAGNAGEHFFFLNSAVAGNVTRTLIDIADHEAYVPGTGGVPYCWANVTNQTYFQGRRGADGNPPYDDSSRDDCWRIDQHTNTWVKFTWMFDATNSKYALWRDGVQVVGTGGNGVDQVLNDGTAWSNIILDLFSSYAAKSNPATVYIDDIVIATALSDVEGETDTTAPTVSAFTIPETASSLTIAISSYTCTDAVGVTGYCINESATPPTSGSCSGSGWAGSVQTGYTFASAGAKTLYAYCKDAAGNISDSANDTTTVTIPAASTSGATIGTGGTGSMKKAGPQPSIGAYQ